MYFFKQILHKNSKCYGIQDHIISQLKRSQFHIIAHFALKNSSVFTDTMANMSIYSTNYFTQFSITINTFHSFLPAQIPAPNVQILIRRCKF